MVPYDFQSFQKNIKYYAYQRKILINVFCLQIYVSTHKTHTLLIFMKKILGTSTFRINNTVKNFQTSQYMKNSELIT